MTIGDLAADRQAYAGPFVCAAPVQPLEKNEDAVEILFIETDAVVLDDDLAKRLGLAVAGGLCGRRFENLAADFDDGWFAFLVELEGVADEILKQLTHLQRIGVNGRQLAQFHLSASLLHPHFQVGQNLARDLLEVHRFEWVRLGGHAGKSKQIVNQNLHALGSGLHSFEIIAAFGGEGLGAGGLQAVAERLHFAQWLL